MDGYGRTGYIGENLADQDEIFRLEVGFRIPRVRIASTTQPALIPTVPPLEPGDKCRERCISITVNWCSVIFSYFNKRNDVIQ